VPLSPISDPATERPGPLLTCKGISKRFGAATALEGMNFVGYSGTVHALLGENGAGKSTFIKILAGAYRPDEGEVVIDGAAGNFRSPRDSIRSGISIVYQELSLIPDLTIGENLWLTPPLPRIGKGRVYFNRKRTALAVDEMFTALRVLDIDPARKVREISVAARQIVEVVRALSQKPRVLVLDEATSAMPEAERSWVLERVGHIASTGTLVIFISHRLPEVRSIANDVTVIRNGKNVLTCSASSATDDELIEAMLAQKPQRLYPERTSPVGARALLSVRALKVPGRVRGVSFDLREGEILGLGGLEGQGQADVLMALFGIARYEGRVVVDGEPTKISSPQIALRSGIGLALVPEDRKREGLLLRRSVRENLTLSVLHRIAPRGMIDRRMEQDIATAAVARLAITLDSLDQAAGTLSGGNQQKVVVGKLLATDARILLFHDLTRGIDIGAKSEVFRLARDLCAQGHSIVFYSSDNLELVHMCDRVLVMVGGQSVGELQGASLTETQILRLALAADHVDGDVGVADAICESEPR